MTLSPRAGVLALVTVVGGLIMAAAPARAETATVEGMQSETQNRTVMTVTPDVAGPEDVLTIEADASLIRPQEPCGNLRSGIRSDPNTVFFVSSNGRRPWTLEDFDPVFSVNVQFDVVDKATEQVGACQARFGILARGEVSLPTAEELRGFGVGDGPIYLVPFVLTDLYDSAPIRFTSGDFPQITLRGIGGPPAPDTSVRESGTAPGLLSNLDDKAGPAAEAVLALALAILLLGNGVERRPRTVRTTRLSLRLVSATLIAQPLLTGGASAATILNMALFVYTFAPIGARRREREETRDALASPAEPRTMVGSPGR